MAALDDCLAPAPPRERSDERGTTPDSDRLLLAFEPLERQLGQGAQIGEQACEWQDLGPIERCRPGR